MKVRSTHLAAIVLIACAAGPRDSYGLGDFGPDTCMEGYVWRQACGPDDHVCVSADTHTAAQHDNASAARRRLGGGAFGRDTCRRGFVWREACGPQDHVCVLPVTRTEAAEDNRHKAERQKYPFCRLYAIDNSQRENAARHCGLLGPRWQENFTAHFAFCLAMPRIAADSERHAREAAIKACIEAAACAPKHTHVVDHSVHSGPAALSDAGRGTRPIATMVDKNGAATKFIANEVIVGGSEADLAAFLARHPGTVIGVVGPTAPAPGQAPLSVLPQFRRAATVVRIDPESMSLQDLDADAEKLGLGGTTRFSSEQGAKLAAIVLHELTNGAKVSFNFVTHGHILNGTVEQGDAGGVADAFKWPEFPSKAWQFVNKHGIVRRVKVAIIDGGFWLNGSGIPCGIVVDATCGPGLPPAPGASDLPSAPIQFDVTGNGSRFAGGPNPNTCTNGAACPWHGNNTASVATGILNNGAGAAGTGGQVADPILLKVDGSDDAIGAALIDAIGFGADIINLSLGGDCNMWCRLGRSSFTPYTDILDQALDSGILVVASAGNNALDALENHVWPCQYSSPNGNGVYCVGALNTVTDANGYYLRGDGTAAPYSNYGSTVNIWAPTNIRAMPNGGTNGRIGTHTGTSASAPFVSGVAAMMKAINPALSGNDIKNIIGNGPYTVGTSAYGFPYVDPKVGLVIRPYEAVVAAAGGYHLKPEISIKSPADGATIVVGDFGTTFQAIVADVNDGPWPLSQGYKPSGPTAVSWRSDVDGSLGASNDTTGFFDFKTAPEGLRHITASVTNSVGETSTATIAITIKYPHIPPVPVITWPIPGLTVPAGTYTVTGHAKSTNPGELGNLGCSSLMWDGVIPSTRIPTSPDECEAQVTFHLGLNEVTLMATGMYGDVGTKTVTINATAPAPGLVVQVTSPRNESNEISTNGGSNIGLSGSASPILPGSVASYAWYWYRTGANPSTKKFIGAGVNASWNVAGTGLCNDHDIGSTQEVTVELDVTDSVLSNPALTKTGTAHNNFHILCTILR